MTKYIVFNGGISSEVNVGTLLEVVGERDNGYHVFDVEGRNRFFYSQYCTEVSQLNVDLSRQLLLLNIIKLLQSKPFNVDCYNSELQTCIGEHNLYVKTKPSVGESFNASITVQFGLFYVEQQVDSSKYYATKLVQMLLTQRNKQKDEEDLKLLQALNSEILTLLQTS